jgi:hypothetical protein
MTTPVAIVASRHVASFAFVTFIIQPGIQLAFVLTTVLDQLPTAGPVCIRLAFLFQQQMMMII